MSSRMFAMAITLGALAAAILYFLPLLSRPGPGAFRPTARTNLKVLHTALLMYRDENGSLPADPRGPSYALYLLKDTVEGHASFFMDPWADHDSISTPRFDDAEGMLVESHFDYLNDPSPPQCNVVVLAELPGLNSQRRYYATLSGGLGSIDVRTSPLAAAPLLGLRPVEGGFESVPMKEDGGADPGAPE